MKIDINGVSITLTSDQLAEIARQTKKHKSYKDITSFEIACEHLNIDIPLFNGLNKSEIALRKLKTIVKAMRLFTNWKPDFNNSSQPKYFNNFDLENGGFSCWGTHHFVTNTGVPSALLLENYDQANFLGNNFLGLFKDYLVEN